MINTVPHDVVRRWYHAHRALTAELRRPDNELWVKLKPGKVGPGAASSGTGPGWDLGAESCGFGTGRKAGCSVSVLVSGRCQIQQFSSFWVL